MDIKKTMIACGAALMLGACQADIKKESEKWLEEANTQFEQRNYDAAAAAIDSIKKLYPNAIDTRKKALALHQNIELRRAQDELQAADSMLQAVQHNLDYQQAKVDKDKAELRATPEELTMLTRTRMKRDSLRTQCEVLGAKIRYIHKKQKELK